MLADMYTADRLKARIWVQAQIRLCDRDAIPAVVARKGDPDAGAILIKLNRGAEGCQVLTQTRSPDGQLAWLRGTGDQPIPEAEADAYVVRQVGRDPDIWVIEIEDRDGRYAAGLDIL